MAGVEAVIATDVEEGDEVLEVCALDLDTSVRPELEVERDGAVSGRVRDRRLLGNAEIEPHCLEDDLEAGEIDELGLVAEHVGEDFVASCTVCEKVVDR